MAFYENAYEGAQPLHVCVMYYYTVKRHLSARVLFMRISYASQAVVA